MLSCCRHCHWLIVAGLVIAVLATGHGWLVAADNPQGKQIAEIIPYGNRLHTPKQILDIMHTRAGKIYDEATIQEDVRRLYNTRWFTPSGVLIHTRNLGDGRITVFVGLTELTSTVQEIIFDGAQHISKSDLHNLTLLRKGDPMNPAANEIARKALLAKYQDDGRYFASVELAEGTKATDTRVVFRIVEGPVVKVGAVEFVGNEHAISGRLRTQLVTKREFLRLIGGKFNPMSMELDRKALLEYYHSLGFLGAQITPEVRRSTDLHHVTIVYHIVEGIQYFVVARQIDGNKSVSTDQLEKLVELQPGQRYNSLVAMRDQTKIKQRIGNEGRNVYVEEKFVETDPGYVQVQYEVLNDRGDPDRVGRIIIEGNEITQDRVILNQLDLRPGQILQYPKLENAQMRLNRLGIFDPQDPPSVVVVPNELDDQFKDIRVRVRETRTGQFMLGMSVNSNAGLNGNIALNERNFDILRWPTSFEDFREGRAFRGNGQEFRISASPGTQFSSYSATWREPYLLDTPFGLTVSDYYFNRMYAEYTENRYGTRITLDRRLDPIWTASLSTRVEGVNISNVPEGSPPAISNYIGSHFLLGLRAGLHRDTRDSFIYPTKGNVFDVGVEQVLGPYTFPIGTADFTQFFSSDRFAREDGSGRHVLGIRTQFAVEGSNAPVYERFYAGGIRSFRGFTFRGVGPFQDTLAVGGTFSFLNTIEYQIPVLPSDKLWLVAFCDHGTVERSFEIKNYRVSVGVGLRISVPALGPMPLALDFGVPIVKGPGDHTQIFQFSMGLFGSQ